MPWVNWYRNVEPSWICCSWRRRKQQPYLSQCVLCINCICRQRVTCFRCLHKIRRMWAIRLRCGWVKIIRQVKRQCVSSSRSLRNTTVSAGSCCSLRYLVIFQIVELEYCGFCYTLCWKQEAQLMLTSPRDMFRGRSRSPTIVPFHMLGRVSSCAIVTLSLRRAVFPIFYFKKCHDLKAGSCHTRSPKVVPFDRLHMICSLETLSLRDIRLQKCRDLENCVRGPSRSLEMSPCYRAHIDIL